MITFISSLMNNELFQSLPIPFTASLEISPGILRQLLPEPDAGSAHRADFGRSTRDDSRLAYSVQEGLSLCFVDELPADVRLQNARRNNLIHRAREKVVVEDDEIGELARLE